MWNNPFFTLRNRNGAIARFIAYGARWVNMWIPDAAGTLCDVILGFDSPDAYRTAAEQYHGALVGRVCGRIGHASFTLQGKAYRLAANDVYGKPHPNHLHGGIHGFHTRVWQGTKHVDSNGDEAVTFRYFSPAGEEGYPGNVEVTATYTLRASNALSLVCRAVTDGNTPLNITNHAFFNLQMDNGIKNGAAQVLTVPASRLIECNEELLPTGRLIPVDSLPVDFRTPKRIADAFDSDYASIRLDQGFSVAYALDKEGIPSMEGTTGSLSLAAILTAGDSGRKLEVYTNQPSLQVYTGYFMDGADKGKNQVPYFKSAGIALEPQGFPDAPNHPGFPSVILKAGEVYRYETEYRFSGF